MEGRRFGAFVMVILEMTWSGILNPKWAGGSGTALAMNDIFLVVDIDESDLNLLWLSISDVFALCCVASWISAFLTAGCAIVISMVKFGTSECGSLISFPHWQQGQMPFSVNCFSCLNFLLVVAVVLSLGY